MNSTDNAMKEMVDYITVIDLDGLEPDLRDLYAIFWKHLSEKNAVFCAKEVFVWLTNPANFDECDFSEIREIVQKYS